MVLPITKGVEGMVRSRQAFTIATGNMVMVITTDRIIPRRTAALLTANGPISNEMGINGTVGIV